MNRGSASVEFLVTLPLALVAVTGMLFLFEVHFARQRTYGALPEIARQHASEFRPHAEARCRIDSFREDVGTSLTPDEQNLCRKAGYTPVRELRRVSFNATTTAPRNIGIQTSYSETRIGGSHDHDDP